MSRNSNSVRRTGGARYDPMGDTWLALIAHAGAIMRELDSGIRFFHFHRNERDKPEEQARRDR